jgi:hypothetical protein
VGFNQFIYLQMLGGGPASVRPVSNSFSKYRDTNIILIGFFT